MRYPQVTGLSAEVRVVGLAGQLLDVGDERTDEEILADTETRTRVITVPGRAYDHRLKNDPGRLAEVLRLVELGMVGTAADLAGGHVLADPVTGEVGYSPPARAG